MARWDQFVNYLSFFGAMFSLLLLKLSLFISLQFSFLPPILKIKLISYKHPFYHTHTHTHMQVVSILLSNLSARRYPYSDTKTCSKRSQQPITKELLLDRILSCKKGELVLSTKTNKIWRQEKQQWNIPSNTLLPKVHFTQSHWFMDVLWLLWQALVYSINYRAAHFLPQILWQLMLRGAQGSKWVKYL